MPLAASTVIFAYITARVHQTDFAAVACSNNNQAQLHTHVLPAADLEGVPWNPPVKDCFRKYFVMVVCANITTYTTAHANHT